MSVEFQAVCPICGEQKQFSSPDDSWSCRDRLLTHDCGLYSCVPRERAIAYVLFSLVDRRSVESMAVHEMSPSPQALSAWMDRYVPGYVKSGYFPSVPFGTVVDGVRNEDAVRQTFEPETFDLVLHLDVLEHLFDPFAALREIHRTLKPGGLCLFTAPTVADLLNSFQVAFDEPGGPRIIG